MKEEIFKIALAFFVGLIPFIVKLYYDNINYRKGQIDRLSTSLFEKQIPIYLEFSKIIIDYQRIIVLIIAHLSISDNIPERLYKMGSKEDDSNSLLMEYNNYSSRLKLLANENFILIPAFLLKVIQEYITYTKLIQNTTIEYCLLELSKTPLYEGVELHHEKDIKSREDLLEFAEQCDAKYLTLIAALKIFIGTEVLSRKAASYITKNQKPIDFYHEHLTPNIK
jgi:hypothetical protein